MEVLRHTGRWRPAPCICRRPVRPSTRVLATDSRSPPGRTAPARDLPKNDTHSFELTTIRSGRAPGLLKVNDQSEVVPFKPIEPDDRRRPDAWYTNRRSVACDSGSRRAVLSAGPGPGERPAVICGEPESQRPGAPSVRLEVAHRDQADGRVEKRQAGTGTLRRE